MATHDKEKVAELAKETNKACGSNITFSVDYASYSHLFDDVNNQNPWAYLANVTDALKHACLTDNGKQSVQAKIKSVSVAHAETETESLKDGRFSYTVPYAGHSPATIIKWFENNL